jgi:hypothetical protein
MPALEGNRTSVVQPVALSLYWLSYPGFLLVVVWNWILATSRRHSLGVILLHYVSSEWWNISITGCSPISYSSGEWVSRASSHRLSLPWARCIQSTPFHTFPLSSILVSFSYLHLSVTNLSLPCVLHATTHFILFDLITLIFGEAHKLWSSSLFSSISSICTNNPPSPNRIWSAVMGSTPPPPHNPTEMSVTPWQ